jgi:hypothetical protein
MGVQVASNLLFAMSLALLIGVTLHLSWELSKSEEEVRRVAEEVAILRADVESLHGRVHGSGTRAAEAGTVAHEPLQEDRFDGSSD